MDRELLKSILADAGEPAYRASQVWEWVARGARDYEEMTNLPAPLRERLAAEVPLSTLALEAEAKSDDGTVKALFHTADGRPIEAVLMRYRDGRRSVCLSSQSGCPLTCTFCATGQMKFGRNLSADEILDQALHFRRVEAIDHVVFMGMGEPTMNIDAVLAACEALPDLGVTNRRTAISTVGWVPGIDRLAECEMPVGLALSLHAPNDGLRSQLMPVNDRYPLAEVLAACERYRARRRRKVFVEYVMLDGVNDLPEHARELAALLDPRVYKVNLIPYNPTGAYDGSSPERIERFRAILAEHRLDRHRPPHPRPRHRRRLRPARAPRLASQPTRINHAMPTRDREHAAAADRLPSPKPPLMTQNPFRRVAGDLAVRSGGGAASSRPGDLDFSVARTHQIAHDPLPLLLGAYEELRADLQHAAAAHAGSSSCSAPRPTTSSPSPAPGELPLARVELRRPDPAARRRPADDRRRLPRPRPGDHDAGLPPRAGRRLGRGDGRRGRAGDRRACGPARSSTSTTGCAAWRCGSRCAPCSGSTPTRPARAPPRPSTSSARSASTGSTSQPAAAARPGLALARR